MAKRRGQGRESFTCPNCGATVPAGAKFCRECGASDESGWNEDESSWAEDTASGYGPDDDFDYDDFVAREFPDHSPRLSRQRWKRWALIVLVVIVSVALLAWMF